MEAMIIVLIVVLVFMVKSFMHFSRRASPSESEKNQNEENKKI
jgi:uncharacterized membrane protein